MLKRLLNNFYHASISIKQAVIVALLALSVGFVFSVSEIVHNHNEQKNVLKTEIQQAIEISRHSASLAVFHLDKVMAHNVSEGLFNHPAIYKISLYDNFDQELVARSRSRPDFTGPRFFRDLVGENMNRTVVLFSPEPLRTETGRLELSIDTSVLWGSLKSDFQRILLLDLFSVGLLSFLFLLTFFRGVSLPLAKVGEAATSINLENPGRTELLVPKGHERDEIGSLVHSINNMVNAIKEHIAEINEKEKALHQSQKMQAVGQLTGGIAHDFNNLLNIVMGRAEMLGLRTEDNEKAQRDIEAIIGAVTRGASLTQRLLAFSRKQILLPQPTEICSLINGLRDMLQRSLGETIELRADLDSIDCEILIDPHQFENALINLAINARDAMPNGGVLTIEIANVTLDKSYVEQYEEVTPGDYLEVTVSDTGTGIAPDVLDRVFEPFFTTKGVGEGSGLGLSMVYGFAKQSNGHITIDSEEGHGTTIKLYLPRSREIKAKENIKVEKPELASGSERILLVEDDEAVRKVPLEILRAQGYEVVGAGDGKEAFKQLKLEHAFDLLFTDVVLPGGINGAEIAEEAKRIQPNIKVLYTTGYAEGALAQSGKQISGEALITKPYQRVELLEKVRAILDSANN